MTKWQYKNKCNACGGTDWYSTLGPSAILGQDRSVIGIIQGRAPLLRYLRHCPFCDDDGEPIMSVWVILEMFNKLPDPT